MVDILLLVFLPFTKMELVVVHAFKYVLLAFNFIFHSFVIDCVIKIGFSNLIWVPTFVLIR